MLLLLSSFIIFQRSSNDLSTDVVYDRANGSSKEGDEDVLSTEDAENVRYDEGGVPIIDGYSNGLGFTQALSKLPLGVSISRTKVDAAVSDVDDTLGEMKDLALANDSGNHCISLFYVYLFIVRLQRFYAYRPEVRGLVRQEASPLHG